MSELEFNYQGMPVGFFEESSFPKENGVFKFMPFRGPGHFEMQKELKAKGEARCYYDSEKGRHFFKVVSYPEYGRIELAEFFMAVIPEKNVVNWLEPWVPAMSGLEKELERETAIGHPLFQCNCVTIARRIDTDDVLFETLSTQGKYAVVHLTWSGKIELDTRYPETEFFKSLDDWIEKRMKLDHKEYMGEG